MITQTYSKDSKDQEQANIISKFQNTFFRKMGLISYIAGENVIVGKFLVSMCLFLTYSKFCGIISNFIEFEGIASSPFNWIIDLINRTSFFLFYTNLYKLIISMFFIYNIVYIAAFIAIINYVKSKDNSIVCINIIKMYQFLQWINFWGLFSWEIEMSLWVLFKHWELSLVFEIISIFNVIFTCFISISYCLFGNKSEFNFELCDYFSRIDTWGEFHFFLAQWTWSLNYVIKEICGNEAYPQNAYLAICFVIIIFKTWSLSFSSFYYYSYTNMLMLYFNWCNCYVVSVNIILYNVGNIDGGDFMIIIGYFTLLPVSKYINTYFLYNCLSKIPFVEIKDEHQLCKYMLILIYWVCQDDLSEVEKLKLIGVVKQHQQNCVYEDCVCKEKNDTKWYIPKSENTYSIDHDNFNYENSKIYFLHLVIKEFEFWIKVTHSERNSNWIMMYSYYMFFYIGNYHSAMYSLLNLQKKCNLNLQQKASLNRISEMIFHKIEAINNGNIKRVDSVDGSITNFKMDFLNWIIFYEKITKLKTTISWSLEFATQFWSCIQNKVEINIIKKHGLDFFEYHNIIEETYQEINGIYNGLIEIILWYGKYKFAVFNEQSTYYFNGLTTKHIYGKGSKKGFSSFTDMNNDKIIENEKYFHPKCVVIIANLTEKNKATIEKISENIKNLWNYSPTECLGQDVKLLMPNIYKKQHTSFIRNHFETGKNTVVNHDRQIFALHSNNYSIPISLSVKLLPNYANKSYYVSALREWLVDYDFIITTKSGKLEMINKGIYNKIFNQISIPLMNTTDYWINYICKEYFDEISKTTQKGYVLSNFSKKNRENKEYKYTWLHFKSNVIIDNILREFKKNESNSGFLSNPNSTSNIKGFTSHFDTPLLKVIHIKDKIQKIFQKDSLKRYSKFEELNIFGDVNLVWFKLYSNISSDPNVNWDEIKIIDKYIYRKEDDIFDKYSSARWLYGLPEPNELKQQKWNGWTYNIQVWNKDVATSPLQNQRDKNNNFWFLGKQINHEQFQSYISLKKRYKNKKEYLKIRWILFYIILFFVLIIVLLTLNHMFNKEKILDIFRSLNKEYYQILPIFHNLINIRVNYRYISVREKYFNDNPEYIAAWYQKATVSQNKLNNYINELNLIQGQFSDSFLVENNYTIQYTREDYINTNVTIRNAWLGYLSNINLITSWEDIRPDNIHLTSLLNNLRSDFFEVFAWELNSNLNSTIEEWDALIHTKDIYVYFIISIISIFGVCVCISILSFYWTQNKMIGMLLSIDIEQCVNWLNSIRELKASSQKKQYEMMNTNNIMNNSSAIDKKHNNNSKTITNTNNRTNNSNPNENDKLIDKGNRNNNNNNNNIDDWGTNFQKGENKKKRKKKKQSGYGKNRRHRNIIPISVYLFIIIKLWIIIGINWCPWIYSILNKFYDEKANKIIRWIQNLNVSTFSYCITQAYFQELLLHSSDETLFNKYWHGVNSSLNSLKLSQLKTTTYWFNTLNGLSDKDDFIDFITNNICISTNVNISEYCQMDVYFDYSYLYILNINSHLIGDLIINTELGVKADKTENEIQDLLRESRVRSSDENFHLNIQLFDSWHSYFAKMIDSYIKNFWKEIIFIFAFNVLCWLFNWSVSFLLLKNIIEIVDVELRNIFSWMPFPLALKDKNIKDLLSK